MHHVVLGSIVTMAQPPANSFRKGYRGVMGKSCFLACVFSLVAGVMYAQSQANTGSIEGTVSDPSGRMIAGASVTIQNTGTNFKRELTTDQEGRFRGLLREGPGRSESQAE